MNLEEWPKKKKKKLRRVIEYAWACLKHYNHDESRVLINFKKNEDDEQSINTQISFNNISTMKVYQPWLV
jgi:hypothetical protein